VQVTAWELPHADPTWLTEEVSELRCTVQVQLAPDGSATATAEDCPAAMQADALAATAAWRFQPAGGPAASPTGPTQLRLRYVLRYSGTIGAMTLHAELDPGAQAAGEGLQGPAGLRLVHEASPRKPLDRKLSGKARKAGVEPAACALRVRVEASGRASEALAETCPDALSPDALKTVLGARYEPTRVDGTAQQDVVDVVVDYR